ncbi:hypothetical protein J6590_089130 [Homalodisca vitripennis]|nr:hypothetical protein J6590_089130 [Homalodisca vitripennis]
MRNEANLALSILCVCLATLSDVLKKLNEASDDREQIEFEINKSFEFVTEQINEQVKNIQLQRKVTDLELRIEDNEQYMRSITLEIKGIPESKNEDVYEVVEEAIDVCHRLKKRNDADRPAGIIAKFVRREDKLKFLEKRRVKRNLDVGHTSTTANPV